EQGCIGRRCASRERVVADLSADWFSAPILKFLYECFRLIRNLILSLRGAVLLLLTDLVGIFGLFTLAHFLRTGQGMLSHLSLVWFAAVFLLRMYVCDVYRGVLREVGTKLLIRTALAVILAAGVVASVVYILKPLESNALYWRGVLPVGTAMFLVWAVVWRKII